MKVSDNVYLYPERGMLDCNTYIIRGKVSAIIDAGSPEVVPDLVEQMRRDGIEPGDISLICNTHLHVDHSWANQAFKDVSGARIMLHPLQKEFFDLSFYQTAAFFGMQPDGFKEDACFKANSLKELGLDWEMIPSPGHSEDSICFYSGTEKCLICGDVIFAGNIGRFDLPGGNPVRLANSIKGLSALDAAYLLPGHMGILKDAGRVKQNFRLVREYFGD